MYAALSPGAVQVSAPNLDAALAASVKGGFAGVEASAKEIADLIDAHGVAFVQDKLAGQKICGFGLPGDFRGDADAWQATLGELPRLAKAMSSIGCTRSCIWILPFSKDLPFDQNFAFHVERLKPAAEIYADHGVRFGLEFIGPETLRKMGPHEFIYTSSGMMELARALGPNAGLLLDAWHWYTAGEGDAELAALSNQDVVYVHVNDAPAGVPLNEQLDNVRCLPGETGVIPIANFVAGLRNMGYDGPIIAEPFKKELADLPSDDARLEAVRASLRKIGV